MTRLLVIEDQPVMRENIALILELNGYEVFSAPDGKQGLQVARAQRPALILCDVMMPELDGYAVLAAIRAEPEMTGTPFIFLTAKGEKASVREGMNLGADDYLSKPVTEEDLLATVRARLARASVVAGRARAEAAAKPNFSSHEPLRALGLTDREAEVLLWVAQGKSNAEIATILGISEPTAKKHVSNLLEKLGLESRANAMLRAIEVLMGAG
jgi:DNA-binding NarL/FixJ family response regulator